MPAILPNASLTLFHFVLTTTLRYFNFPSIIDKETEADATGASLHTFMLQNENLTASCLTPTPDCMYCTRETPKGIMLLIWG